MTSGQGALNIIIESDFYYDSWQWAIYLLQYLSFACLSVYQPIGDVKKLFQYCLSVKPAEK